MGSGAMCSEELHAAGRSYLENPVPLIKCLARHRHTIRPWQTSGVSVSARPLVWPESAHQRAGRLDDRLQAFFQSGHFQHLQGFALITQISQLSIEGLAAGNLGLGIGHNLTEGLQETGRRCG